MDRFKDNQRVRVSDPESPLLGKAGTVVRLRRADDRAWVRMDDTLPMDLRVFPEGDDRANHAMLWPEECDAVSK